MHNPFLEVEYFEKELAEYCGSKYAVAVDSCTSGLFLVFKFLNLKNEKIIFPRKTYLSMPMMALATSNKVILKDYKWEGLYQIKIVKQPNIVIYDSAKRLTRNDFIPDSIMLKSFHMKKHITSLSGKGGAVLTDDIDLYNWLQKARWEGRNPYTDYKSLEQDIDIVGYNMNMTPEEAVFLRRQLSNVNDFQSDLLEPDGYRNLDEFSVFDSSMVIDENDKLIRVGGKSSKVLHETFILRQLAVHGTKYKTISQYKTMQGKMLFECNVQKEHGVFEQKAQAHLSGQGCPVCNRNYIKNIEHLQNLAKNKKGKCLSNIYKDISTKYMWECEKGHTWEATANKISTGTWCPICSRNSPNKFKYDINFCKTIAKNNNGNFLSKKCEKVSTKYMWECEKGHKFNKSLSNVIKGFWCLKCNMSSGERIIYNVLNSFSIIFEKEHKFENCKRKKSLPFDFFLPEYNTCIEYDGSHHFIQPTGRWQKLKLHDIQERDQIKNSFCKDNNINLIRIPYFYKKSILDILKLEYELGFPRTLNLSELKINSINLENRNEINR